MADFNFISSSPANQSSSAVLFKPTTQTALVNPSFESVDDVYDQSISNEYGLLFTSMSKPVQYQTPRRPSGGQLYPRGNQ
jgi:hypothetical protein